MSRFVKKNSAAPQALAASNEAVAYAYVSLQRTQRGLVGMLIACSVLGMTVFRGPAGALGNRTFLPIIFSTTLLTFAYTVRNAMAVPALVDLRRNPRDGGLLKRWTRYNLMVQSLCAGVGLIGFAMQLLGAAPAISITLYVIAIAYLFLLAPQKP